MEHALARANFPSVFLSQVVALGHSAIRGSVTPSPLEFRNDQVYELFYRARAVDRRKHESVASNFVEERLELIGDALRCSYELR